MFRDDDTARAERAHALIDEIAKLERQKLALAPLGQRLEAARLELSALQPAAPPAADPRPGVLTHAVVFAMSAAAAFVGYTLLF